MTLGSGLRGALKWSAAEEAAVRIAAVKTQIVGAETASDRTDLVEKQLRHGLTELDSIRQFLQEGINLSNKQFVDSGVKDGVLHAALEKGLTDLEEVRKKLVSTLSSKPPGSMDDAARPVRPSTGSASDRVHREEQERKSRRVVHEQNRKQFLQKEAEKKQLQQEYEGRGKQVPGVAVVHPVRRAQSAKARPKLPSAVGTSDVPQGRTIFATRNTTTEQPPPAANEPPHVAPPRQAWEEPSSSTPVQTATHQDAPKCAAPTASSEAHAAPPASRLRPSSAPNRARVQPPRPLSAHVPPASSAASATCSNPAAAAAAGMAASPSSQAPANQPQATAAWNKYQDWAQSVLNHVHSRKVQQHRSMLFRQNSFPNQTTANTENVEAKAADSRTCAVPPEQGSAQQAQPAIVTGLRPGPRVVHQLRRAQTASVAHLRGVSAAQPHPAAALSTQAQQLREQGNICFQQKRYSESAVCYSKAIELESRSETLYCNRAAAYLMLNRFQDALADSLKAIELDPTHVKAHWRAAKAYLYLGNSEQSRAMYAAAFKLADSAADSDSIAAEQRAVDLVEKCRRCLRLHEWQDSLSCADAILDIFPPQGPCSVQWQCLKAEALLNIDAAEAGNLLSKLAQEEPNNPEVWYLRAKSLFYTAHDTVSTTSALGYTQRAKELDPHHARAVQLHSSIETFAAMRDEGNAAYAAGRWQDAHAAYTKCLNVDAYNTSLKAIILCNRAAVCIQCERWKDGLDDINQSIGFNPNNAKAYTRRSRVHQHNNNHEMAIKDLQIAVQLYPSAENQERLTQAIEMKNQYMKQRQQQTQTQQQQQQHSANTNFRYFNFASQSRPSTAGTARKRPQSATTRGCNAAPAVPSYYDTLGVPRNCDEHAVVKAYREAALKWHPDKWATGTTEQQSTAERVFKEVSLAYQTLKDPAKRRQYDLTCF